jgi:hypothetical protein
VFHPQVKQSLKGLQADQETDIWLVIFTIRVGFPNLIAVQVIDFKSE